jgi:hypothetical protein
MAFQIQIKALPGGPAGCVQFVIVLYATMVLLAQFAPVIAGYSGGWEAVMICCAILLSFGSRTLPPLIGRVLTAFRAELDQMSIDAGRSVGGIYAKPAAEALTPDNQTAELYEPSVFRRKRRSSRTAKRLARRLWSFFHTLRIFLLRWTVFPLRRIIRKKPPS